MSSAEEDRKAQELGRLIDLIERRELDRQPEARLDIPSCPAGDLDLLRVASLCPFWKGKEKAECERFLVEDALAGLYGMKMPFAYLLTGNAREVGVYIGARSSPRFPSVDPGECLASSLRSTYPGIELQLANHAPDEESIARQIDSARAFGILTGIPTRKVGTEDYGIEQIERLARGLRGQAWAYLVLAEPIPEIQTLEALDHLLEELRIWHSEVKISEQRSTGVNQQTSVERVDRLAQYYTELLDLAVDKLKLAKASGMWWTAAIFFSPDLATYARLKGLLLSVFAGEASAPEPMRALDIGDTGTARELVRTFRAPTSTLREQAGNAPDALRSLRYMTALNTRDLATIAHLPKEEMPGYNVVDFARFGVCVPDRDSSDPTLNLGHVVDRGLALENRYLLPASELTRHGLIAGVTGSGKTNTSMVLLDQLWQHEVPFLVIEPAKGEYRRLLASERFRSTLQVFTLGDETESPFRLNPFEILPGTRVQTHVDHLKAVFNASLSMWAPLPTVLERCIHEVYVDKGWDLALNRNRWATADDAWTPDLFPTMTELYEKIDDVVEMLGYEQKVTMDVKAALKTRINGLRVGGKGLMLDTPVSVPLDHLLARPTILELRAMGDDDEKAFVMGLLLMRIYQQREAQVAGGDVEPRPHITLIEEAHRLLARTSDVGANPEQADVRGKAVETFCNVLSEMRACGEGILIAEQIPVKLAPDAIKNTNLKIVHRLVSVEDRETVGGAMCLQEDQMETLAILERGKAAMYQEGLDEAVLVQVPDFKDALRAADPPDGVGGVAGPQLEEELLRSTLPGCRFCRDVCRHRSQVRDTLFRRDPAPAFSGAILTCATSPESGAVALQQFLRGPSGDKQGATWCLLAHASSSFFRSLLGSRGLDLPRLRHVHDVFLEATATVVEGRAEPGVTFGRFAQDFRELLRTDHVPYSACSLCATPCLYREAAQRIARGSAGRRIAAALSRRDGRMRRRTIAACRTAAEGVLPDSPPAQRKWCAYCIFLHKVEDLGFDVLKMAQAYLEEEEGYPA